MGGIFSKPKIPDTRPQMEAQQKAIDKQTEILEKQEMRLEGQEKAAQRQAASSARARRRGRGGYRLLLSAARGGTAAQGLSKGGNTTLGA